MEILCVCLEEDTLLDVCEGSKFVKLLMSAGHHYHGLSAMMMDPCKCVADIENHQF